MWPSLPLGRRPSGPDQAGDGGAGLGDLVVGDLAALGDRLADAVLEVLVYQPQGDRLERLGGRRDLGEHVDAVVVLLDHPRDPADLAFDAAQPPQVVVLVLGVAAHAILLVRLRRPSSYTQRGYGRKRPGWSSEARVYDPELDPTTGQDEVAPFFTRPL